MDPFLGPAFGALLAALGAGGVLGVVRLHRLSLDWWRRRAARSPKAAPVEPALPAEVSAALDPAVAPPVFAALAGVALALLAVSLLTLVFDARRPPGPAAPLPLPSFARFAARSTALVGFAVLTVVATLGIALLVSLLDRGLGRLVARGLRRGGEEEVSRLTVPDLVATARALLGGARAPDRGEPFGVGLAYAGLFAAAALGVGALLAALGPGTSKAGIGFGALAGLGFLATPVFYAAAAERSRDPLRARLRRDAAVRQLAAAPAWCIAGALTIAGLLLPSLPVLVPLVAGPVFAVAIAIALPGAGVAPGAWIAPPVGGDRAEPAVAVRVLTGIAHYAWLTVCAVLPFLLQRAGEGSVAPALGFGTAALVVFLAVRAALARARQAQAITGPAA